MGTDIEKWEDLPGFKMSEMDLAYAAGFLDGEGCFSISKSNHWKASVSCSNTDREIVAWFHENFGGHFYKNPTKRRANHRPVYQWKVVSNNAAAVCSLIAPYLRQKTEQALLIIALQQTMNFQGARKGLPAEIIEQRNWFSDHCQELKRVTA